jgi:hypothetical protein
MYDVLLCGRIELFSTAYCVHIIALLESVYDRRGQLVTTTGWGTLPSQLRAEILLRSGSRYFRIIIGRYRERNNTYALSNCNSHFMITPSSSQTQCTLPVSPAKKGFRIHAKF